MNKVNDINSSLWNVKYRPKSIKDLVGNVNIIKEAIRYLKSYRCAKPGAKFPKAILISGPSGCGKTEFAKMLALYRGFIPIEFSASQLRMKKEISYLVDVYNTDISKTISPTDPNLLEAKHNLNICNMGNLSVGKAILVDELDAMTKGERGFSSSLLSLLKSKSPHSSKRLILLTCGENILTKFRSLGTLCHHFKFTQISEKEILKVINRVCENENLTLSEHDKLAFVKYSNGDCRRLLNGMEMCFKNGTSKYTISELSNMIASFINDDEVTLNRLKYSGMSTEKILCNVINDVRNDDCFHMISDIESDMYTLGCQVFKTYLTLIRRDISCNEQIHLLADASDKISDGEFFQDMIKKGYGGMNYMDIGQSYVIQSILNPLHSMKDGIPKNFKVNVDGYAKVNGIKTTIDNQLKLKRKLREMGGELFFNKTSTELVFINHFVGKMLQEKKYKELSLLFHANNVDPTVIEELSKLKILRSEISIDKIQLKDVWKGSVKREFKKQYSINKPKISGLKFKDSKRSSNKILFFEKFAN